MPEKSTVQGEGGNVQQVSSPRVGEALLDPDVGEGFAEAVRIMMRLRAPGGCPWDQEQDFDSIRRHTVEETYEVLDAIEKRDWTNLKEELGDMLLQVLFYSQMAREKGYFSIADVTAGLNAKLIRRHPHVFGDTAAADSDAVLKNWEQIKVEEKTQRKQEKSAEFLEDVSRSLPGLMEAQKLGAKAARVGFDWPEAQPVFEKLAEEMRELAAELGSARDQKRIEEELGDVLFTAVNLARKLKVDAEMAMRGANGKFRRRFALMEGLAAQQGRELDAMPSEELEELWRSAKQAEVVQA